MEYHNSVTSVSNVSVQLLIAFVYMYSLANAVISTNYLSLVIMIALKSFSRFQLDWNRICMLITYTFIELHVMFMFTWCV